MSLHLSLSLSEKGKRETGRRRLFCVRERLPRDEKKDMQCTDDSISGQVKCCESVFYALPGRGPEGCRCQMEKSLGLRVPSPTP